MGAPKIEDNQKSRLTAAEIAENLESLPTLPSIVYELSQVIGDPMSSTSDVEKIMANDPSMTAKVLKLANSAYYAIPGGVSSLQRAIAYIGYDAIHQLVLSASIMKALGAKASVNFDTKEFWKHCLGVAMAAETTAKFVHHRAPSDLFTCGLVHDIGKVALFILTPDGFAETVNLAKSQHISFTEAEDRLGSPAHGMIGKELAIRWRLPTVFQAVTLHHHTKDLEGRGSLSAEMNQVVDIVSLSNLLIHALHFGNSGHDKVLGASKETLERLQLTPDQLKILVGKIKEAVGNAESFLKIIGS